MKNLEIAREIWSKPPFTICEGPGAEKQIANANTIATKFNLSVKVVKVHRSKSQFLPVIQYKFTKNNNDLYIFTRDNFYNAKIVVISSVDIYVPYDDFYFLFTEEEYNKEKQRAFDYASKNEDFDPNPFETDEWYVKWESGTLFHHDEKIYKIKNLNSINFEGINNLELSIKRGYFPQYTTGSKFFAIESADEDITDLVGKIINGASG